MSKNYKSNSNNKPDWKSQLLQLQAEIEADMTDEEKRQLKQEEQQRQQVEKERKNRIIELNKRRKLLYEFLAGYKQNSGIFINNFFRNRDYKTYCEDKFHEFSFDVSGIMPNVFDDLGFSFSMVSYLDKLEDAHLAYYPISRDYIERLINFAEVLDILEPLQEDTILYRGCSTLERNGVNGIVSTTTDKRIAEQFSRGTILTMIVPKGTKCLRVKSIRPKEQRKKDHENEILLPPCSYEILSEEQTKPSREPNNHTGKTHLIKLKVKQLDILEEFLKMADNPPNEYIPISFSQGNEYLYAVERLRHYIDTRNQNRGISFKKSMHRKSGTESK